MRVIIYKHTCLISNKSYIGVTGKTLEARWNQHRCAALSRNSPLKFHRAIRKYGPDAWSSEILWIAESWEDALRLEREEIERLDTVEHGYNLTKGGEGTLGRKPSDETRAKIGAANRGRKKHPDAIERTARGNRGKKRTRVQCDNIRNSLKGHSVSDETRAKIGAANKGNRHPPELLAQITEKITGENSKIAKSFLVMFPDGHIETVKGLANFCRLHGLHASAVRRCLAGKLSQHHGFSFREAS